VKLGLAHWRRIVGWGCSVVRKTLEPKRKEVRGTGLNCAHRQVLLGRSKQSGMILEEYVARVRGEET